MTVIIGEVLGMPTGPYTVILATIKPPSFRSPASASPEVKNASRGKKSPADLSKNSKGISPGADDRP